MGEKNQKAEDPNAKDVTDLDDGTNIDGELIIDEPYLGSWKTKEAAEEGVGNLQRLLDSQGNELGTLRKQSEFLQRTIDDMKSEQAKAHVKTPEAPNFSQELKAVQKEIAALDLEELGYQEYQTTMGRLIAKSNELSARDATQKALDAAQIEFKKALDERDTQAAHKEFYRDNSDFSTPEMQERIQEQLSKDTTGMSDPMVAYREIQRDDALAAKAQLENENAELKRLLELKKGEEDTGKVVTKGQGTHKQKTKQTKATGADLDAGMQEALDKLRESG